MFKLDNNFLTNLGLGSLPVDEKNKLLQAIYERLEMNVGMRLAEKMTDAQLDEFEGFIDRNDEAGALRWLESNFPNYKQVVAEELEKLKNEVAASAPQILAAAQAAPLTGQPAPQPPQGGYQQPQEFAPPEQSTPYEFPQQGPTSPAQPMPFQPQPTPPTPQQAQPGPAMQPWRPEDSPQSPQPGQQPPAGFPPQQ